MVQQYLYLFYSAVWTINIYTIISGRFLKNKKGNEMSLVSMVQIKKLKENLNIVYRQLEQQFCQNGKIHAYQVDHVHLDQTSKC